MMMVESTDIRDARDDKHEQWLYEIMNRDDRLEVNRDLGFPARKCRRWVRANSDKVCGGPHRDFPLLFNQEFSDRVSFGFSLDKEGLLPLPFSVFETDIIQALVTVPELNADGETLFWVWYDDENSA